MSEGKAEFRVTIEGPEQAREELLKNLKDMESEADRSGVDVSVERIVQTENIDAEFTTGK